MTGLAAHESGDYPVGANCLRCSKSEARCAFDAGCCDACTHTFSEVNGKPYICIDCSKTYLGPPTGGGPERCPVCYWRKTGSKPHGSQRARLALASVWDQNAS